MANSYDCYARIYLPLTNFGQPYASGEGYYDLELDGKGENFGLDTYTRVKKPVLCYGDVNGLGAMKIFNEDRTFSVLPGRVLLCKYKFEATSSKMNSFITTMRNCLTYSSGNAATGNYALYRVTAGVLQTYSTEYHNPFYATAVMCDLLGDDTLLEIYNRNSTSPTGYQEYRPWKMFDMYHNAWSFETLHL